MSIAESATRTMQKNDDTTASAVAPKRRKQPATSSAVSSSTAGYRNGIGAAQWRQRPRRSAKETTGMLSYAAISWEQVMQAERPLPTDRRSGTREATTLRKLPRAR